MIRAIVFDLDDTLYDCLHENDKAVEDTVRYVANELLHIDEVTVMKAFEEGRDMVKDQLSAWDMAAQHCTSRRCWRSWGYHHLDMTCRCTTISGTIS